VGETRAEQTYRRLQQRADGICSLIVASDYPGVDIAIQIRKLRGFAERHYPRKAALFDRIYGSRFRRLWAQFRPDEEELPPEW
jgi:hypothetical protein